MRIRQIMSILSVLALAAAATLMPGCKAQQQMQQQLVDMDAKLADAQRRITALDSDQKKTDYELTQLKGLVTKLGNVTVELQRGEEERQKAAAEAKARAEAAKKVKKPLPKKKKK